MVEPLKRPKKTFSIRKKLALSVFLSFFLLTMALVAIQQYFFYVKFENYVKHTTQEALQIAIQNTEKWLTYEMNVAKLLAMKMEKALVLSLDAESDFSEFCQANKLEDAYLGLEDGRFLSAKEPLFKNDDFFKKKLWYRKTKRDIATTFVVSPGEQEGQYALTFAAPVMDRTDRIAKGVAAFNIPLEEMKSFIGSVFVDEVERLDLVNTAKNEKAIFAKTKNVPQEDFEALIAQFKAGGLSNNSVTVIRRNKYFVAYKNLETAEITLVYPISLTHILTPLLLQAFAYLLITVVCLWVITLFAWQIIKGFAQRIEKLNDGTARITGGDFESRIKDFSSDEIGQLAGSFNKMVDSLKEYMRNLEITTREKEAIAKEFEIASQLQQNALPKSMPVGDGLQVMAKSFSAKAVGGDYYDFLFPEKGETLFVIADVSGKGLPSSLFMFHCRSIFRTVSVKEKSPAQILMKVNNQIFADAAIASGMFITFICGVYDMKQHRFTYSNAGHFPLLLYSVREKTFKETDVSGIPVGILPDQIYEESSVDFAKDDILVFYTDGIIEAKNKEGDMFGLESLKRIIIENRQKDADTIFDSLIGAIQRFSGDEPQFDDMTLLVIKAAE